MVEKQAQAMVSQSRGGTGDPLLGGPQSCLRPHQAQDPPAFLCGDISSLGSTVSSFWKCS